MTQGRTRTGKPWGRWPFERSGRVMGLRPGRLLAGLSAFGLAWAISGDAALAQRLGNFRCQSCNPPVWQPNLGGRASGHASCPECARWGIGQYSSPYDCIPRGAPIEPAPGRVPPPTGKYPGAPVPPAEPGERAAPGEPAPAPSEAPPTQPEAPGDELFADSLGTGYGYESAAPNLIGDFFGGGSQRVVIRNTVPSALYVRGVLVGGVPGSANAVLAFENVATFPPANDFTTNGLGTDVSGDGNVDTFPITEPVPPNNSPVSPGPGFVFDGGTASFTGVSNVATTAQDGQFLGSSNEFWYAQYSFSQTLEIEVPAGGGSVVRRVKLGENNSPDPRDRVYWNYNFFNDVPGGFGDVNRYVFGFEKTFRDRGMSIDVRFPFASTLAAEQIAESVGSKDMEFGNATVSWKTLLYESDTLLLSGGVGAAVPTGDDTQLFRADGRKILQIDNDAVHILPYVAMTMNPRDTMFFQGFLQFDIDSNGNPVAGDAAGAAVQRIGKLHDSTYMFLDMTAGYWLYRDPYADVLRGVVPVIELHYSTTLQDSETLTGNGLTIAGLSQRFDVLNMTVGTHVMLGQLTVTPAIAIPLRDGDDEQFDMEALVLANWYF